MAVSVAAVMRRVNNYFEREVGDTLAAVADAPFVAVEGLGVFEAGRAPDQPMEGRVWGLYPPDDFLALCREIEAFDRERPPGAPRSESFGAYRYELPDGGWEAAFASRLLPYRRMFTEVRV